MGELKFRVDELVQAVKMAKAVEMPYRLDWSMATGIQTLETFGDKWKRQFRFGKEVTIWYCDQKKRVTKTEFLRLPWKKTGCAHQVDQACTCECHKELN